MSFISAFATSSSSATLPITLKASQDNFGASKDVSNFVLPIGATMNMDGTAMYEAAAALFIANLVGLRFFNIPTVYFIFYCNDCLNWRAWNPKCRNGDNGNGASSIRDFPLEALGILIPMDRLLDTFRTTVNVEGDLVGTLIIDKLVKT